MDGRPRAKTDKTLSTIKETEVPWRLYLGVFFLVIGIIVYLVAR